MALARVSPSSAAHGAKQAVAAAGVSAGLIDMHTIKPLDEAAVLKAAHTSRIVLTVEEHNILGGLGSAVAEVMAENPGKARLKRHGILDEYALISPPAKLYQHYRLDGPGIHEVAEALL